MSVKVIRTKILIEKILKYIGNYVELSGGHMVDFFVKNLYTNCIPLDIQKEIMALGHEEIINLIINQETHPEAPVLNEYIKTAKSFSLYNLKDVCVSLPEFEMILKEMGNEKFVGLKLDVFMKLKKAHEVELLSSVAAAIQNVTKTSHLIDIGDGKGYLSSLLALHHEIPVLGVDASPINTESAIKRVEKLGKHWKHIFKIPKDSNESINLAKRKFLYKQVTKFVTERTDFNELINNVFLENPTGLGLVGLHTCGNLGSNSIRIFSANKNIKSICNVSCCYHLLNENYVACSTKFLERDTQDGFPISNFLISKDVKLGREARMLSAQSIDRILAGQELPSKIIFYRAIFEVMLKKFCDYTRDKNVGKYRKEPEDFLEYSREAFKRVGLNVDISDAELEKYYDVYEPERIKLNVFHLIRSMLAPAIESLILLDRYLFLLEQGHENVYLVQLFDPIISPRCYGLVAFKDC